MSSSFHLNCRPSLYGFGKLIGISNSLMFCLDNSSITDTLSPISLPLTLAHLYNVDLPDSAVKPRPLGRGYKAQTA